MAGSRKLTLQILGNAKGAVGALGQTESAGKRLGSQMGDLGKKAGLALAGIGVSAGYMASRFVSAAYESQKVMKQTEAIIKATGEAAGMTAKEVSNLATTLSNKTGIDDEQIQTSLNMLLTFKQVRNEAGKGNDVFNRAAGLMLDLGNVFGSTDSAAMQLGKALSDPVKGISALRRAGINFTESQKDQIKQLASAGKVLEAQKIILAEVESQVGGTAAAAATGMDRLRVAIGNAAEDLGGLLIPYVERFSQYLIENVVPVVSEFSDIVGQKGLGAGIKFLSSEFFKATANMGAFGNIILTVTAAIVALRGVMLAATVAQVAFNVALLSNPIGIAVAAVIALGVALAAAYIKFEGVRKVVNTIGTALKDGFLFYIKTVRKQAETLYEVFRVVFNGIATLWNNTVGKLSFKTPSWLPPPLGGKGFDVPDIPMLAEGGIVDRPTLSVIGERGAEAVVPLDRYDAMRDSALAPAPAGSGGDVYITVQAGVGDPTAIGRSIVEALQAYQRRVGTLNLKVA
jgi:hypothetical protein